MQSTNQTLTAIEGITVGHVTNTTARTGCTVILCPAGATAGVDVRGAAPGTRETEALRSGRLVQKAYAVLLTGGSAFGLDAAGGVVQYLEEQNVGFPAGSVRVPIVPAAVIFDLSVGDAEVRPDRAMGYQACLNATDAPVAMGAIGAGTGATVGKAPGVTSSPGGVGSACVRLDSGLIVAAIAVVNALGNVVDPTTGEILAGGTENGNFVDITERLLAANNIVRGTNTTIGVVATNATLTPAEVNRVAEMAHDGMARAIRPAHTMFDGDTLFALATGSHTGSSVNTVGILAAEVVAGAIVNAVTA
ncbi:P1 family peptidase [Candidatus Poribacteria bacterium]|nr:P1 family peptidase [Candidatus Poribacteria bacterium]MXY28778.1 P1 family peptidase [Candidatus Poribacteria bacterium]MYK19229.1 P1 family peptidase [Candidatus Poribacteria bacterium]